VKDPRAWFVQYRKDHPNDAARRLESPRFIANMKRAIIEFERLQAESRKPYELSPEDKAEIAIRESQRLARANRCLVVHRDGSITYQALGPRGARRGWHDIPAEGDSIPKQYFDRLPPRDRQRLRKLGIPIDLDNREPGGPNG
jgi:hypothetical protein